MITAVIVNALMAGITALLSLMPDLTLPTPGNGWQEATVMASTAGKAFPIHQVMLALGFTVLVRTVLMGWDLIVFVYHQFWGAN